MALHRDLGLALVEARLVRHVLKGDNGMAPCVKSGVMALSAPEHLTAGAHWRVRRLHRPPRPPHDALTPVPGRVALTSTAGNATKTSLGRRKTALAAHVALQAHTEAQKNHPVDADVKIRPFKSQKALQRKNLCFIKTLAARSSGGYSPFLIHHRLKPLCGGANAQWGIRFEISDKNSNQRPHTTWK